MTNEELSYTLRDMGRAMGMCDKFYDRWVDGMDVDTLLDMYISGFDFCIAKDFPPTDFINRNFNKEDLHRHHIYIDEDVSLDGENGTYIFLGHCTGNISFKDYCFSSVYLRHTSSIKIRSADTSRVFVSMFEKSSCDIIKGDNPYNIRTYDWR